MHIFHFLAVFHLQDATLVEPNFLVFLVYCRQLIDLGRTVVRDWPLFIHLYLF